MTAPYVGLRPFKFHESHLFYGRGEHIAEMVRTLRKRHFLAVVGSSGSGKSSLVRAGLLPAIHAGFMDGDEGESEWRRVIVRPGLDPYENLLQELLRQLAPGQSLAPDLVEFRRQTLRGGPRGLIEVVDDSLLPEPTRLVVLIDQFEEIFRFLDSATPAAQWLADNIVIANGPLANSPGVHDCLEIQRRLDAKQAEIADATKETERLTARQERLRKSIAAGGRDEQTTTEKKLVELEDRLLPRLRDEARKINEELRRAVLALSDEWSET